MGDIPSGARSYPNWNWDDAASIQKAREMYPGAGPIQSRGGPTGWCLTGQFTPYDPNTLCDAVVPSTGMTVRIPCDMHPGPRAPTAKELEQWWYAAVCDYRQRNSWGVANGDIAFAQFVGPDGVKYRKFYNGDVQPHNKGQIPPNTLLIAKSEAVTFEDIGAFLIGNLCKIGGMVTTVASANPQAGAGVAAICGAITGQGTGPVPLSEGSLVQGSGPQVYIIRAGQRCWIPDMETFTSMGLNAASVRRITDAQLAAIPLGPTLPSVKNAMFGGLSPTLLIGGAAALAAVLLLR